MQVCVCVCDDGQSHFPFGKTTQKHAWAALTYRHIGIWAYRHIGISIPVPYKTPAKMRISNASEPLKRREHCTTTVRQLFLSTNTAKPQREGEFYTRPL